jgi:hypothetical protein
MLTACSAQKIAITPTPLPTTALPTSTQVPPRATPTPNPTPDMTEWDLLIISDSTNWGVGQYYAKLIETDMNVKVNLHDCWVGALPTLQTLQTLQNGGTWSSYIGDKSCNKPLTDLVKEAEVMVLFGNPRGADASSGSETCISGGYQGKNQLSEFVTYKETLLSSCAPDNWDTYKTNLGLLIDEIFRIREGTPLILRMTDLYIPLHSYWIKYDVNEVCTACLGSFSEAIRQVADEHGVPVADTIVALNGKDFKSEIPSGYIRTDGVHLTDSGAQFVATLLQQTGYAYAGK